MSGVIIPTCVLGRPHEDGPLDPLHAVRNRKVVPIVDAREQRATEPFSGGGVEVVLHAVDRDLDALGLVEAGHHDRDVPVGPVLRDRWLMGDADGVLGRLRTSLTHASNVAAWSAIRKVGAA